MSKIFTYNFFCKQELHELKIEANSQEEAYEELKMRLELTADWLIQEELIEDE